jgi:hypothetical protein
MEGWGGVGWGKAPPTTKPQEYAVPISVRIPDEDTLVPIDFEDTSID